MSVLLIAQKEFRDAIRSRVLFGLTALFVVFTTGGILLTSQFSGFETAGVRSSTSGILFGLISPAAVFVPVIATLISYKAIAAERERGSIYCLLGLSHSRADVIIGNMIGRSCVVAVSILVGFSAGAIALVAVTSEFRPVQYLVFTGATILLGVVYVSIVVSISSATGSTTRAAWGAFGGFVTLNFLWEAIGFLLYFLQSGSIAFEPPLPEWLVFFNRLSPASAYQIVATEPLPADDKLVRGFRAISQTGGDPPFFLANWFSAIIFLFWVVLPTVVGYACFRRAKL